MKIEHFALNVSDPVALADWYVSHLGMKVVFQTEGPPYARFLADSAEDVMIEVYANPTDDVPDYATRLPAQFHVAFTAPDPEAEKARLLEAGATFVEDVRGDDGSYLIMLRDPWGIPLQLCRRGKPFLD